MITAQDIREKTFEKSKFGGYDMAEVDEFLEQLANDLTASQKETAVLRSKMKVLVDKIEEYRSNESALNQSILSAQKLAQQIEAEAREKADRMISDAQKQVDDTIGSIAARSEFEEKRLAAATAASAKFIDGIRAMCNAQLKNLDSISLSAFGGKPEVHNEPAPAPAPVEPEEPEVVEEELSDEQEELSIDLDAPYEQEDDLDSTQPFTL
jgi:cell division initiation protein